jgi:hypothetical protein
MSLPGISKRRSELADPLILDSASENLVLSVLAGDPQLFARLASLLARWKPRMPFRPVTDIVVLLAFQ